jgi:hypothetical protein
MNQAMIVVANAARVRGFCASDSELLSTNLDIHQLPGRLQAPKDGDASASQLNGSAVPRGAETVGRHGPLKDPRATQELEQRKHFARAAAKDLAVWVLKVKPPRLIVVASRSMRTLFEESVRRGPLKRLRIQWLTGDFSQMSEQQVRTEFERLKLLA